MSKLNEFFDKLFIKVPGYIFGLLTFVIGFFGFIIAILLSPEYLIWEKSISVLGHQTGGIFSRMGLIISNTIAIPFIIYLGRSLKDENLNENTKNIAVGTGIFISVIAALSGAVSGSAQIIKDIHGFFALISWIGGIIVCLLFGLLMRKSLKYSKFAANFSLVIAGIFGSFLIPFFITNFCSAVPDICGSFGRRVYTIMPTFEWIVMFSILIWYLFYSIYIIKNKI
jgi:uncharacterized membrane protein YeaQ/YmgE (transglycosylase-associated protein family)